MLHALIRRERCRTLSHRQLPRWAVMEPTEEPPLGSALVSIAHMQKEINVSLVNYVAARFKLLQLQSTK
jgi:hypothetical protein